MMAVEFIYRGEPNPKVPPGATRVIVDESVNIIPAQAFQSNLIVEQYCHDAQQLKQGHLPIALFWYLYSCWVSKLLRGMHLLDVI